MPSHDVISLILLTSVFVSGVGIIRRNRWLQGDYLVMALQGIVLLTLTALWLWPQPNPWHAMLIVAVYYVAKNFGYHYIHSTFFDDEERMAIRHFMGGIYTIEHLILLPVSSLIILCHLPFIYALSLLLFVIFSTKIALVVACVKTIFTKRCTYLHFFAYLCALEIAPLLILGSFLVR